MKATKNLSFLCLLMLSFTEARTQPTHIINYVYQIPSAGNDGIPTSELRSVYIDSSSISRLTNSILTDSISNVHSLLIYKDGRLVYENYFPGKDQRHGKKLGYIEHSAEQLHDCRSISKSVVSACIGIAIKNGSISSVNDPIGKYFPEIDDSIKKNITIRQLLTMSSGLDWKEIGHYGSFFNSETQMSIRFNPIKYTLRKDIVSVPGSTWNYSAGNTQLLAEIVHRTTGLTVDKFAEQYLFLPLGIKNYEWTDLSFKKIPAAASGLRLTSRDLLKFGMLYLNKGNYNGTRILDSAWVEASLHSYIQRPDLTNMKIKPGGYGYQFWTYNDSINGKSFEIIEAKGNGGQSVLMCPGFQLIVVTTGGNYNKTDDGPYTMLKEYILPDIRGWNKDKRD